MATNDWNLLVLAIDRLNTGPLGPYGNTWVPTRAMNRFASESWLAEFVLATSSDLRTNYRALWRGEHPDAPRGSAPSLVELWREAGRHSLLVTDDADVAALPEAQQFDELLDIAGRKVGEAAEETPQTQIAQLMAATIERLGELPTGFAVWMHARGMSGPWDAPKELREHLRDDEDPPAATLIAPPSMRLPEGYDPDELLPITQAYAAQVLVVDECLEALSEALAESGLAQHTLVVLTSPRGFLLGQQRYVGAQYDALLEDLLHVPLLVRYPDGRKAAQRELGLLEQRDLFGLLADPHHWSPPQRDRVLCLGSEERAMRTSAWHLRVITPTDADAEPTRELYAKPDDRYEVNDVALRCQEIVAELQSAADSTAEAIRNGTESHLPALREELKDMFR